jgi:AcrR family transcriptional regulator
MAGNAQHTDHLYLRNPGSLESLRPVYCGPVADTGPEGSLARTHQGKPGLPRGSNRLPLRAVQTSHRERLQRSVIAAVAETSYPAVTVADIVRGARVSRSVFYAHFADKEDCFLAAGREGARLMYSRMASATQAVPPDAPDEQVLRAAFLAFLQFLADEPTYARVLYVDALAAGPLAAEGLDAASRRFADLNRKWHRRARTRHPEWPSVPDKAYEALSGAVTELIRPIVRAGQTDSLPGLVETLMSLHMAVLAARPWTA